MFTIDTSSPAFDRAEPLSEHMAWQCERQSLGEMAHVLDRSRDWLLHPGQCAGAEDYISVARKASRLTSKEGSEVKPVVSKMVTSN